jgi:hypothetical protein
VTGIVDTVDISVEIWGGLVTNLAPSDLPHGVSPDCQDVQFQIGSVKTRPGSTTLYILPGTPLVNYLKTYETLNETPRLLSLDSLGVLRKDSTPGGALTTISGSIIPGAFCRSDSLFAREYLALSDGMNGLDMPRQYDDTYFDRVSQVGPGAAPSVADSGAAGNIGAGVHMLTVIFVTRSGYYTRPAPPVSWTAAGSKKAAVTNIPVGPPNVVARILSFTAVAQASFYHLGPLGLTLANSNMYIADNVTTSLTVDFTDQILLLGTLDDPLFTQIELPPVGGTIGYSSRLFHWGEQANIQNFINLPFDGGYGGTPSSPSAGPNNPATLRNGALGNQPGSNWSLAFPATCVIGGTGQSKVLGATGFGFAIPSNATITGVLVAFSVKCTTAGAVSDGGNGMGIGGAVFLTKDGGVTSAGVNHANGNTWTTAFANQNYGSGGDLWGTTLSPTDVNSANFGVTYFAAESIAGQTATIQSIGMTIAYTLPGAGTVPLGWTAGASVLGGASANAGAFPVVFGDAYSITGDGATAERGQITQSAAVDYLTNPIIVPGMSYGVRARVASAGGLNAGTLHVNLQSTSGSFTTAGLAVQAMQTGAAYALFTGVLTSALIGPIPADLLLQVYADGTPNNGGVFLIDNIEIYPLNQQFNNSNIRASKGQLATQGQESYDSETGLMQYNLNDGQSVRNLFKIRERLYIVKEHSFGVTQDDGVSEPALWAVNDVSKAVGTPSINGVGLGEDWAVIAHRTGLYLYWGGGVEKISEEIQPTWDSINWQFGSSITVSVDVRKRRIFICAPFGNSTIPNMTLVMDYHDVGADAAAISANPPIHLTYTGTKKAFDRARKWAPWTISANSCAQIELANGLTGTYFGSNNATGNINVLDQTGIIFTDSGNTIPSYYTTAAFAELPTEDAKQLRSHRHLYTYLTMYVQGIGTLGMTVFPASLSNGIVLNSQAISNPSFRDNEMMLNVSAERMFIKVASQGGGQNFDLQRMVVNMKQDPWAIVRGAP